jgi:23S rRNA (uridine2552-2'-O)-methyltransferase
MARQGGKGAGGKSAGGKGENMGRRAAVRVRTARQRSASSTQWLERQLNDPYVGEARQRGLRSRAAFKLMQLDDRFHLLRRGQRIVDLGCAPGGWLQVAVERTKPAPGKGCIVGIDILPTEPVAGAAVIALDFLDETAPARLKEALGGEADLVMSDMAAPTTGHGATDHLRIIALAEAAYAFAAEVLAPDGAFIAKVFQGGAEGELLAALKRDFALVRHAKPPASRAESAEMYVVATGFRCGA